MMTQYMTYENVIAIFREEKILLIQGFTPAVDPEGDAERIKNKEPYKYVPKEEAENDALAAAIGNLN